MSAVHGQITLYLTRNFFVNKVCFLLFATHTHSCLCYYLFSYTCFIYFVLYIYGIALYALHYCCYRLQLSQFGCLLITATVVIFISSL